MKFTKAFTLIEVLLVVAIGAGIFALSAPYSLNFYHTQLINDTQSNIIDALQRARHYAILQKNDSDFGVYLSVASSSYTLFQGDSYSVADINNEVFPIINSITFATTTIVFSKLTGVTSTTSTTTLTYGTITRNILVDESGAVSKVD